MRVIVAGVNAIGLGIVEHLVKEGNDVTIVDDNEDHLNKINEMFDVNTIHGKSSYPLTLEQAGAIDADLIIAVNPDDEVNMVTCQIAHSIFNVPNKIASIRHQDYMNARFSSIFHPDHIPIDYIISPEMEVAKTIYNRLQLSGAVDSFSQYNDKVKIILVKCEDDTSIARMPISKILGKFDQILVSIIGIIRKDKMIFVKDDDRIMPGDQVFFLIGSGYADFLMKLLGYNTSAIHRLTIVGGGNVGLFLAQMIEKESSKISIKLIEHNKERAEYIAEILLKTTILHGNALELTLLEEAGVSSAETLISVTNDDEVNIISAFLAKEIGCKRVITLLNNTTYNKLLNPLKVDVAVDPKEATISTILQAIRRGKISSVHSILGGEAEIIEEEIEKDTYLDGKTILEADIPEEIRICSILRGDNIIIPDENTKLYAKDRLIILTLVKKIRKLEQLLSKQFGYV